MKESIRTGKEDTTLLDSAIRSPEDGTSLKGSSAGASFPLFGSLTIHRLPYVLFILQMIFRRTYTILGEIGVLDLE